MHFVTVLTLGDWIGLFLAALVLGYVAFLTIRHKIRRGVQDVKARFAGVNKNLK